MPKDGLRTAQFFLWAALLGGNSLDTGDSTPDVFTDINGLVAAFLDDIADRPVPVDAGPVLGEIRQAVANGSANTAMALKLIELFPNDENLKSSQKRMCRDSELAPVTPP